MKKYAILFLLLFVLLNGCTSCKEAPAVRNGFVSDGDSLIYYRNDAPVRFSPGIQTIDGKAYYVEADGVGICGLTSCCAKKDGQLLCFKEDSSLLRVSGEGFVSLEDGLYYAQEEGYALCTAREQVLLIGDALFAFDAGCRVMALSAGVQDIFGSLYYVPEDGAAIDRPPEGPLLLEDGLYYANADGTLAANAEVGYLCFGADGRYTSGSETLDAQVEALLTQAQVGGNDPIKDFRLCYAYIRDNFRYLSMAHYPAGSTDWAQSSAEVFFRNGKGNCYCWAAAQMYCARRLGIQAYCVAGWEDKNTNDHAWVMAEIDGETYLFDAELEYALINIYGSEPVDMFMTAQVGGLFNGFSYYFP